VLPFWEVRVESVREHGENDPRRRRYNWCPRCMELWVATWMARVGVEHCPLCDGPVYPSPGRSRYDAAPAASEERLWPSGSSGIAEPESA
jgi:hypothetical protein